MLNVQNSIELRTKFVYIIFFLALSLQFISTVKGQDVIFSNSITGENPNTNNPFTAGQQFNLNIVVSGIGRGMGINGSNANDRYSAKGWNSSALNENDYFTFTLTPNSGYRIDFISFVYTGQTSGTGPTSFAFRSSLDDFSSDFGSPASTGGIIDLSNSIFQNIKIAIEFRLYAWSASSAAGTFSVNNFTFSGNVVSMGCSVPEPAGTITGPTVVTPGQKGVVYSVNQINNANGYEWSLPGDAIIASGNNTNSITVDFGNLSGAIRVWGTNSCGDGSHSPPLEVIVTNAKIYYHDFGTTNITSHPYLDPPVILESHLSNLGWSNSKGTWTSYSGSSGQAIAMKNSSGTPIISLNISIDQGYELEITDFDFWMQRSVQGAQNWTLEINGNDAGNGTIPTTGTFIGKTSVANTISDLTGTVSIGLLLSGASGSGTFRLDDFTLYGNITCTTPIADSPSDVVACKEYVLPALNVGNYYTAPGGSGSSLFEGDTIKTSQLIYVYATTGTGQNCSDENSFSITILPLNHIEVSIMANKEMPVCKGTNVAFVATPLNEGTSPIFQWKVNGNNVGLNRDTFSYIPEDNNTVSCELISSEICTEGNPAISNFIVQVYKINTRITPFSTENICPQLSADYGFNPDNNGPYNPGTTQLNFNISRENSNSAWSFYYTVSGGIVNSSYSPFYPSTGTVGLDGETDEFNMILYINNTPGSEQIIELEISNVTDTDHGCVIRNTSYTSNITINEMPVVGSFY
jgi:hypothetical protein